MNKDAEIGPFENARSIVLGSASPRRRELLSTLGVSFKVRESKSPETLPRIGENPAGYARRAARAKAEEVSRAFPDAVTIGADTIVVLGETILGKPLNHEDAFAALCRLAGRSHTVITACCLKDPAYEKSYDFAVKTEVWMADYPREVIRAYAYSAEPLDKAGSYAIQGQGGFLVRRIEGSYSNVVGLPLAELADALVNLGAIRPRKA